MAKVKVILVDDDPDELFFMEKGFASSGLYTIVAQFSGGEEMIEFLYHTDELPHLVITDLNMPRKNGNIIAREIVSHPAWKSIKVVVLSITSEIVKPPSVLEKDGCLFMAKPSSLLAYQAFAVELHNKIAGVTLTGN